MGSGPAQTWAERLGQGRICDPDAEHTRVRRNRRNPGLAGLHSLARALLAATRCVWFLRAQKPGVDAADRSVSPDLHQLHGNGHRLRTTEGRLAGDRLRIRPDAGPDRARLQRGAQLLLRHRHRPGLDPVAERSPRRGLAPAVRGRGIQAELRTGASVDGVVCPDRPHRRRARDRRLSLASQGRREIPHRTARAFEPISDVGVDGDVHDDQPLDPRPTHHGRRLMADSTPGAPRRVARPKRPSPKPVGAPFWLVPAAVVAGIAVLIGAFLLIRHLNPPAPPPIDANSAPAVVAEISAIPPSELDKVGLGSATNSFKRVSGTALTAAGKPVVLYIG